MKNARLWLGACLLALVACGPFTSTEEAAAAAAARSDGGTVVSADEAHVHDVDADWVDADILYVETIDSK